MDVDFLLLVHLMYIDVTCKKLMNVLGKCVGGKGSCLICTCIKTHFHTLVEYKCYILVLYI